MVEADSVSCYCPDASYTLYNIGDSDTLQRGVANGTVTRFFVREAHSSRKKISERGNTRYCEGGCYRTVSTPASTAFATSACSADSSVLPSVFDEAKEDFLFGRGSFSLLPK